MNINLLHCTLQNVDIELLVEPAFAQAFQEAAKLSGLGPYRMRQLWLAVGQASKLPAGDFLEVGTYKGGSALLISRALKHFKVPGTFYTCDTFAGLVKADPSLDVWKSGEMAFTDPETIVKLLPGVVVMKGVFPESAPSYMAGSLFRFAHIDVDIYQSAKDIWHWLWPRLVPGALVVFDDVEVPDTPGITRLVAELEKLPGTVWFRNSMYQAICVKL